MATESQIEANRANAQMSTGPKTEAGKAASSQNARTHGLSSPTLTIPEHEREDYEIHRASLLAELDPAGAIEQDLFKNFLDASWRLIRIQRMEDEIFQNGPNPLDDPETAKKLDRLFRYRAGAERSYVRFRKELEHAQTAAFHRDLCPNSQGLPKLVDITKVGKLFERAVAALAKPQSRPAAPPPSVQHTPERPDLHFAAENSPN